jgi:ribosomal protein L33
MQIHRLVLEKFCSTLNKGVRNKFYVTSENVDIHIIMQAALCPS